MGPCVGRRPARIDQKKKKKEGSSLRGHALSLGNSKLKCDSALLEIVFALTHYPSPLSLEESV